MARNTKSLPAMLSTDGNTDLEVDREVALDDRLTRGTKRAINHFLQATNAGTLGTGILTVGDALVRLDDLGVESDTAALLVRAYRGNAPARKKPAPKKAAKKAPAKKASAKKAPKKAPAKKVSGERVRIAHTDGREFDAHPEQAARLVARGDWAVVNAPRKKVARKAPVKKAAQVSQAQKAKAAEILVKRGALSKDEREFLAGLIG